MEASAIVAGTAKQEAAKTLIGWTLTRKAIEMYNVGYAVLAMPNIAKPVKYLPENIEQKMIKNDLNRNKTNNRILLNLNNLKQKKYHGPVK